ncbi:MAG: cytochrome o ubiquinol oxidase subunit I, partial [Sphingomonas sp.]
DVAAWHPWLIAAAVGAVLIAIGIACQIVMIYVSIRDRERLADTSGDPWDGRTLEWITTSPPPPFNFAVLPNVQGEEAYWDIKSRALEKKQLSDRPEYEHFEMPHNSPTGIVTAFFATVMGFALIWHIWWMVILGFLGAWATFVAFAWRDQAEYEIPASEVEQLDRERRLAKARLLGLPPEELDGVPA